MCWSYFEGTSSSLGKLKRDCSWFPASLFISAVVTPRLPEFEAAGQEICPHMHSSSNKLLSVNTPWLNVCTETRTDTTSGWFPPLLRSTFYAALTTDDCCGNRSSPSLAFSHQVSPSFPLPTYPDCWATRTAPRQPALAAARFSVPACLLALLRCQLHLRPASQPGTWWKEGEEEEKGREQEKRYSHSDIATQTAAKLLLSTKGSETDRGAFFCHHRAV